jgi:hypothetical protein
MNNHQHFQSLKWRWEIVEGKNHYIRLNANFSLEKAPTLEGPWLPMSDNYLMRVFQDPEFVQLT